MTLGSESQLEAHLWHLVVQSLSAMKELIALRRSFKPRSYLPALDPSMIVERVRRVHSLMYIGEKRKRVIGRIR
jgi:hypothetical protein